MKQNPMQRWEEQQRLKLMSKKIASAKSVLRSLFALVHGSVLCIVRVKAGFKHKLRCSAAALARMACNRSSKHVATH